MNNADKIRHMPDEDLALMVICPYDTVGSPEDIMPCIEEGKTGKDCYQCTLNWLRREHHE